MASLTLEGHEYSMCRRIRENDALIDCGGAMHHNFCTDCHSAGRSETYTLSTNPAPDAQL